jgi:hypothetical protein
VDAALAEVYLTVVGVAVSSPEQSEVMFGAIVVGLLVSALAAGGIVLARAWSESRGGRVREVPPLIVIPRSIKGVEPVIGAPVISSSPVYSAGYSRARPQMFPTPGERTVFDDTRLVDDDEPAARGGNSETVRFIRPGEEPIQILPGRLEVLSGDPKHREIRFVRSPGEPAELILGREPGRSPQSVALNSDTVSRRHARFAYSNGRWAVTNLSRTNPVVVNDVRLPDNSIERPLADGDRVELGEVVLRFRSR